MQGKSGQNKKKKHKKTTANCETWGSLWVVGMALHHLPEDCADMPDLIEEKRAHGLSPANFWRGMGQ
jgi:hypothetical protein